MYSSSRSSLKFQKITPRPSVKHVKTTLKQSVTVSQISPSLSNENNVNETIVIGKHKGMDLTYDLTTLKHHNETNEIHTLSNDDDILLHAFNDLQLEGTFIYTK